MKSLVWIPFLLSATWAQDAATEASSDSLTESFSGPDTAAGALGSLSVPLTDPYPLYDPAKTDRMQPGKAGGPYLLMEGRAALALLNDFQIGGRVGGEGSWRKLPLAFFFDLEGRPYRRAIRVRESETLEYQYREERLTFGPGASVGYPVGNDSTVLLAGAGAGISPAWYRGSERAATSVLTGWAEGGLRFLLPNGWHFALMYQYFPLPGVSSHRLSLVIGERMRAKGAAR